MRKLIAALCLSGALLLIAASMVMNWTFWTEQGATPNTARIFGAISIGIDIFKACLPLVIAWGWAQRSWLGILISVVLFCGCLTFSLASAIGFASSSRGTVTENRASVGQHYLADEQELKEIETQIGNLGAIRPQTVIEEAIDRAKQDRRWSSSNGCVEATVESSRAFCQGIADLRIELASAKETKPMRDRASVLKSEMEQLQIAGAQLEPDQQAGVLARLSGIDLKNVQMLLTLLLALLVEFGAAFGLFLAQLPLQGQSRVFRWRPGKAHVVEAPKALEDSQNYVNSPRRLVRANGRLMIE